MQPQRGNYVDNLADMCDSVHVVIEDIKTYGLPENVLNEAIKDAMRIKRRLLRLAVKVGDIDPELYQMFIN